MQPSERLRLIAPELSNTSDDTVRKFLELADEEITLKVKGARRERLIINLAAHYMTLALSRKGSVREISSITEGKLSITYSGSNAPAKSDLSLTGHGRTYERLARSYVLTPLTRECT